jgi:very-short-patch-repair endonuclease
VSDRLSRIEFARQLRRNMTDAERALWRILGRLRPRFTTQYSIGPYVADFACRRARLIVEVDGGQHVESEDDVRRTAELDASGWRVLRYWNNDVLTNTEGVVLDIIERGRERLPPDEDFEAVAPRPPRRRKKKEEPPPAPPRSRGGERAA